MNFSTLVKKNTYWEKQCIYNCEIYVYLLNISKYNKDEQKKWGIIFFSYPIEKKKKNNGSDNSWWEYRKWVLWFIIGGNIKSSKLS